MNSLAPEERRKVIDDNGEDYEVAGLMCDSDDDDGDVDILEIASRESIAPHFGVYQMFFIGVIIALVVLIKIWSRRCEEKKTDKHLHGTEGDQ